MPITRAQLEAILITRNLGKMSFVNMDVTTMDGTNADLNDAIVDALGSLSITPANLAGVGDSDLLNVTDAQLPQLRDFADVRVLETVLGRWDQCDQMASQGNTQWLGKLYDSFEKTVARRRVVISTQYSIGLGTLKSGTVNLNLNQAIV